MGFGDRRGAGGGGQGPCNGPLLLCSCCCCCRRRRPVGINCSGVGGGSDRVLRLRFDVRLNIIVFSEGIGIVVVDRVITAGRGTESQLIAVMRRNNHLAVASSGGGGGVHRCLVIVSVRRSVGVLGKVGSQVDFLDRPGGGVAVRGPVVIVPPPGGLCPLCRIFQRTVKSREWNNFQGCSGGGYPGAPALAPAIGWGEPRAGDQTVVAGRALGPWTGLGDSPSCPCLGWAGRV